MTLITVEAVYEDGQIRLLESPPVRGVYRVLVTFLEPVQDGDPEEQRSRRIAEFQKTFGTWQDDRPIEETIRDLHGGRA